jgi:murein DD-endopeptidase MepM/ murein hydrolase activator NlpD
MVRLGIATVLLLVASLSSMATTLVVRETRDHTEADLAVRNRLLKSELTTLNYRVDTLRTSLEKLYEKDEKYRLLAGLTPIDLEVLQAGIGGPDADSLEARPLYAVDAPVAKRAFSTGTEVGSLLRRARLLSFSWREATDTLKEKYDRLEGTPSITPTRGYITSRFSGARRHPLLAVSRPHTGVDIVAPRGTPILAAAKGRVKTVTRHADYGLMVEIDHGRGLVTRYAHTSAVLVKVGQEVLRGDTIARVGDSGLAVGSHLLYEVLINGQPTNPDRFLLDLSVVPD